MAQITQLGPVLIPVRDPDEAIRFYTTTLGFTKVADIPYPGGERWVELEPPRGGPAIALGPITGDFAPRATGISLLTDDAWADHAELRAAGVDIDERPIGGKGGVPWLFFFRDRDGNQLIVIERDPG